jgi:hypothetical protein
MARVNSDALGETPTGCTHDPIPDIESADLLTQCGHDAGELGANDERQWRLVLVKALNHQYVWKIECRRTYVNQQLPLACTRLVPVELVA